MRVGWLTGNTGVKATQAARELSVRLLPVKFVRQGAKIPQG